MTHKPFFHDLSARFQRVTCHFVNLFSFNFGVTFAKEICTNCLPFEIVNYANNGFMLRDIKCRGVYRAESVHDMLLYWASNSKGQHDTRTRKCPFYRRGGQVVAVFAR